MKLTMFNMVQLLFTTNMNLLLVDAHAISMNNLAMLIVTILNGAKLEFLLANLLLENTFSQLLGLRTNHQVLLNVLLQLDSPLKLTLSDPISLNQHLLLAETPTTLNTSNLLLMVDTTTIKLTLLKMIG